MRRPDPRWRLGDEYRPGFELLAHRLRVDSRRRSPGPGRRRHQDQGAESTESTEMFFIVRMPRRSAGIVVDTRLTQTGDLTLY
jgi:hypothetical protein